MFVNKRLKTAITILLLFCLSVEMCFGKSYSGQQFSGYSSTGIIYDGVIYEPLSTCGTLYEGIEYNGLCITNLNISEIVISGNEEASDLFIDAVVDSYDVNWKKVIGQFAIGTSVIVVSGIAWFITGKVAPIIVAIPKKAFQGALTGSIKGVAVGMAIGGTLSALKGEPKEGIYKASIEGLSSGFMWGAISGAISGTLSGASDVAKTINSELTEILKNGPLHLSSSELADLCNNPTQLRSVIYAYTGKSSIKDGFLEFFIRLANTDPDATRLLLGNSTIKDSIETAIRSGNGGGNHEWLMVKHFLSFLTDSKWGGDGQKLAVTLTHLVQKTDKVVLKSGKTHQDHITAWHNELAVVIEDTEGGYNAILNAVYKYAKRTLTTKSFNNFKEIFALL